jgi:hypothetical protein
LTRQAGNPAKNAFIGLSDGALRCKKLFRQRKKGPILAAPEPWRA